MNRSERIKGDTPFPFGVIGAISGGNRGTERVAMDLMRKWDNPLKLLTLDNTLYHDHRLWCAYKYVCDQDIDLLDKFIDAVSNGEISEQVAHHAIDNRGDGLQDWIKNNKTIAPHAPPVIPKPTPSPPETHAPPAPPAPQFDKVEFWIAMGVIVAAIGAWVVLS